MPVLLNDPWQCNNITTIKSSGWLFEMVQNFYEMNYTNRITQKGDCLNTEPKQEITQERLIS